VIGTLRRAGFSVELAVRAFSALDSYIYGFGRQHLNMSVADGDPKELAEGFLSMIPADEYPYLREVITEYSLGVGHDEAADFDFGLGLILDGLGRALESAQGA
jgi:hypothetical protein